MNCAETKELLSAYYDDELSPEQRALVAQHLAGCAACAQELEGFRGLTAMAEGLAQPETPAHLWPQIEGQLSADERHRHVAHPLLHWLRWKGRPAVRIGLAMAAAILIAVGWLGYDDWFGHDGDHQQMAAVFGQYLDQFATDPQAAQQLLLAHYNGQPVDAEQAIRRVGYRPAVAAGMPTGYTLVSTHVFEMPCCKCVQSVCRRSDGSTIAIFEHDYEQSKEWFSDRPVVPAICNGVRCNVVDLDHAIAVDWVHGERHITVIGLHDTEEVGQLAAWFNQPGHT